MVPWIDAPATPAVVPEPTTSAPPAPAWPSCEPSALRPSYGSISDWAGSSGVFVAVTNTGARGCVLTGAPTSVELVRADGSTVRVKHRPIDAGSVLLHAPAALTPGQRAEFVLAASDMCQASVKPPAVAFTAFRFRVAAGPWMSVTVPGHGTIGLPCARRFSGFGVRLHAPNPVKTNPLHVLTVTASMPATVAAGEPVHYQVTLRNPTDYTVALDPCPTYTEFLTPASSNPRLVEHSYRLDCAGAGGHIPARTRVDFAMQIPAPQAAGEAKFGWSINTAGLSTGRALTVTNQ